MFVHATQVVSRIVHCWGYIDSGEGSRGDSGRTFEPCAGRMFEELTARWRGLQDDVKLDIWQSGHFLAKLEIHTIQWVN